MSFHVIDEEKPSPSDKIVSVYTMTGDHDFKDEEGFPRLPSGKQDDVSAYAKKIEIGARHKYYVKRGRHGRLYNPYGLYSEGTAAKQRTHAGKPEWEFSESNEKVFSFYINFLKTNNAAWLNNAERES